MLQWSHAFSDVETAAIGELTIRLKELQWSHAFSDVETRRPPTGRGVQAGASMEPRLLRRGNGMVPAQPRRRCGCFNGATPSQTWKPRRAHRARAIGVSFNGATPSQTWKQGDKTW